jgi:putative membrane protein insertion efficiency factor
MKRIAEILIKAYQAFSSTREPRCKYYPSCSNYAATAIRRYGLKGVAMASWRLLRCNPWSEGGLDYVDYELDSADALAKAHTTMVSSMTTEGVH